MMNKFTEEQAQALLMQQQAKIKGTTQCKDYDADEGKESVLQHKIEAWCNDKGYVCLSFRQSRKAKGFLLAGFPDLSIFLPGGKVLLIELKSKCGRLSEDQKMMHLKLLYNGHQVHNVKSYKQFLDIIEET